MDQAFWDDVQAVFAAAAEAPPGDRAALLDQLCAGRPAVRAQVESLLTSSDVAGDFLEQPLAGPPAPDRDLIGRTVGGFRLVEQVGQGGMGSVFAALRDGSEFTQRVAVKLIDLPVRSEDALRRFRSERQILAGLNHPHIVTFLDGGIGADGQAFLVMEFVDGVPITRYCADGALGLEARLRLFQLVCGAVQYAHQHAVVHRDLKPGNILVTPAGAPKMLDFGVARLVDTPDAPADATTGHPFRALTPNYASPEQLRGLPVTTASDIYALGVLLHEVLAGRRPYETAGRPLDAILAEVLKTSRSRPSDLAAAAPVALPYPASALRGDLDAIVLKALSVDPAERYASAQELADDLGRVLSGAPVLARPPSFRYVAAHLVRRHRAAFTAGAVSLVAIVLALGVSLWQTHVARRERLRAEQRFGDARQLATAVLFGIHDDVMRLEGSIPVRKRIVTEALAYLERLSRDPAGDAEFRIELARGYFRIATIQGSPSLPNLGDRAGARTSYQRAIDILTPLAADPHATHDAAHWLADVHRAAAGLAQAMGERDVQRGHVEASTRISESLVARRPDVRARRLLAASYFDEAMLLPVVDRVDAWRKAAAAFEQLLAEAPDQESAQRNVAIVAKYLGSTHEVRGEFAAALEQHEKALAIDERRLTASPDDRLAMFDVAIDLGNVAYTRWQTGDLEAAAAGYERSLVLRERMAARDATDVQAQFRLAFVRMRLALVYGDLRRFDPALEQARQAVAVATRLRTLDVSHRAQHATMLSQFGRLQAAAGRRAEACTTFREAQAALAPFANDDAPVVSELNIKGHLETVGTRLRECATQ